MAERVNFVLRFACWCRISETRHHVKRQFNLETLHKESSNDEDAGMQTKKKTQKNTGKSNSIQMKIIYKYIPFVLVALIQ